MQNDHPFIIAEMSGNHNHSLDNAFAIIDAAAESGVDAIKIQTYTADTISMKGVFKIEEKKSLWFGRDLYDLYDEAHTPWDWHEAIFDRAKSQGIICFSSPFDESAVDLLESLENPIYKIASFEINHIPLLKKVASTGKPVIMSTGASSISEIEEAVCPLKENGCKDLVLLKCTSTYPALPIDAHLNTIPHLKQLFNCEVGLSDHTLGIGVSLAAIALGAKYIEKHFCLSRTAGGVDSEFSMEPEEMRRLVDESKNVSLSLGQVHYGLTHSESIVSAGKRSIYVSQDIKIGEKLSESNIKVIRPGFGLHPRHFHAVLGAVVTSNIQRGSPLLLSDIGNTSLT